MDRAPKHRDVVVTTRGFLDELWIVRALVWEEGRETADPSALGRVFASDQNLTFAIPPDHFKQSDYGLSWVFEDDVEGAAAFKVAAALS